MEDLAYALINQWGVGSKTLNNGVVILFSTGDDDYYVTMGYGIEKVLDVGTLRLILDDYTEPKFAVQDYDGAMADTFVQIYNVLAGYYGINKIASLSSMPTPSGKTYNEGDPYEPSTPSSSYDGLSAGQYLIMCLIRLVFWILIIRFILWVPYAGTTKYWAWWLFRPAAWRRRHPDWRRPNYVPSSGGSYTTYHGVHGSGTSYHSSPSHHSSSHHSSYHGGSSGSFHSSGGSWGGSSHSSSHSSFSGGSHGGFSGGGGHGGGAGRGR